MLSVEKYVVFLAVAYAWLCWTSPNAPRLGMVYAPTLIQLVKGILLWPLFETIVYQWFIIEITRRLKWSAALQLTASMTVFAAVHFIYGGAAHGVLSGLLGGYYLAFTYLTSRERSLGWAFVMTFAFHSLHNGMGAVERWARYG